MMEEYKEYDRGGLLRERYHKVNDISEGSYGLVSVAKDTKNNNKLVAVKFIYPIGFKKEAKDEKTSRPSSSPAKLRSPNPVSASRPSRNSILLGLYEEAQKEIRIHKILGSHPNVTSLYDHFDSYLILEYCSRGDLYEAIHGGNGPSTSQDIKDVFSQILVALEYCHSHQVYHRDLKPENILIAEDWTVKICDWGLATTTKIITNKEEFDIGSERYMAPELFDPGIESYDASKIDLWSVGVILLTLVFHKNPFQVANYSDKRFLQFVNNREALFDIFSTMSGDMFSITRFCLNIDPGNRDLISIKNELDTLRYFTIDEEYWGSEEEEDLEEDYEFEMDSDFYKKDTTPSPQKITPIVVSIESQDDKNSSDKHISESISTTESESIHSKSSQYRVEFQEDRIPHNHRADALLSSNTELKPIPIGGKLIRNTRKPFNVASYNHSHSNARSLNSKFNREEFFTPKSVYNHYMDKYGEQRFGNIQNGQNGQNGTKPFHGHHNHHSADWKKNKRPPRSWKKTNKRKPRTRSNRNRFGGESNHHQNSNSTDMSSQQVSQKKKTRSASTSKLRRSFIPPSAGNSLTNSFHNLGHPMGPQSLGSSATSTGKYVPPYLRSPAYTKSPVIEPLTEEIDRLTLANDYDEVFHLEDDFDLDADDEPETTLAAKTELPTTIDDILFKKPNFRGQGEADPIRNYGIIYNHSNGNGMAIQNGMITGRRNSALGPSQKRPASNPILESQVLSTSAGGTSGKYVPPFRRGSHSAVAGNGKSLKIVDKKDEGYIHGKLISNPLVEINNYTTSSVPLSGRDWFDYKKDWSDYD